MQRSFFSSALLFLALSGSATARATESVPVARPATVKDTIVIRLPDQATLTLTVRDAAQLRQLKNYHLDSLTTRLAGYIAQAQTAAKNASTEQVTVQYYPDKDQPGKNLPEQIRITTRKKAINESRVDVLLNKAFGVVVTTDADGGKSYNTPEKSKAKRVASRDSTRLKKLERKSAALDLVFDVGLNVLANQKTPAGSQPVELRTEGSRYVNIGFDYHVPLVGTRTVLSLMVGPEVAFNNYMLNGNDRWVSTNGRTSVARETDGRQFEKTKLATSSINLPLMLRLQLRDSHYKSTFSLGAGGFVGYRLKTWTKLKYLADGTTYKDKDYASYNMEDFLYGLQGTIGFRSATFFAKYNLNQLFKTNAGPDTQVLSFGVRILGD